MNYKRLGDFIQQINLRNTDLQVDTLLGVSISKKLIPSIANIVGADMSSYKIIKKGQFAYSTVTSRNGEKISIALADEYEQAIISQIYVVFEIIDKEKLLPEYLMMWFQRPEFDRYARFHSHGSTRETFDWEDMCQVLLPIPSIEEQRRMVAHYQSIATKIKTNTAICEKLEATAQVLYKHWFMDFEFPDENQKPYASSGGKMMYHQEIQKEIPIGWEVKSLGDFVESFSKSHTFNKDKLIFFNTSDILNGEFLHSNYMNVEDMPGQAKKTIRKDDILYSEIRPNNKRFALVRFEADDYVVSTKLMVIRRLNDVLGLYRIYYYLTSNETIEDFQKSAEGRSGTFPQITFEEDLKYRKIVVGNIDIERKIEEVFSVCYHQVYNLKDQNKTLEKLQALLLKKMGEKM